MNGWASTSRQFSKAFSESARSRCKKGLVRRARILVDNKFFVSFGTLLTIWALTGDDLRVMLTDKPADVGFNGGVLVIICFFVVEVFASCIGKDDYYMGFFFCLDVISTATLFLDLTWVADDLFNGGGGNQTDKARSSKTARAGARVGRVVRVLRLVRIVKLFKAMQSHNKDQRRKRPPVAPGSIEEAAMAWEDAEEDEDQAEKGPGRESLVGKKLSNRTTQRTIVLVLVMLIILPMLGTDSFMRTPASAEYAADDVDKAFGNMREANGTRRAYEDMVLRYVHYHNWFLQDQACPRGSACSNWFYSQVYWIGLEGMESAVKAASADAQLRRETVESWNAMALTQDDMYNFGTLPAEALEVLFSPWSSECSREPGVSLRGMSLLKHTIPNVVSFDVDCPRQLRMTESEQYTPRLMTDEAYAKLHFVFYFDLRPYIHDEAVFSLLKTLFVCVVLCVASVLFSKDANALVLRPVEHMITKVEQIRDNPLSAMKIADDEYKREEMLKLKNQSLSQNPLMRLYRHLFKAQTHELMETVVLEKTIIKLGSLLALGFGEAGAEIVRHNMKGSNSAFVDAMIEGKKVDCIVGNARIQDFSIATEVLQAKVMTFVNQVAEIVHGLVDQYYGAVNKNKGDLFLVIWRMNDASRVQRLAEMSVMAFTRIVGAVHGSHMLAQYRHHPGLQQRLRSRCRVSLAFGLHFGWTIEGAVGSEFKIDASYLSPNVSIAASIQQATRIYDVCFLVSEAVVELCTPDMAAKLRLIDKVRIRGSKQPLQLYSMDLDYESLKVDECTANIIWNTQQRYLSRQLLDAEKKRKMEDATPIADVFEACQEIAMMRRLYTFEFRHVFSMGYQNYSEGEWEVARSFLDQTQSMLGAKDGPSGALLKYMETGYGFKAPAHWQGVRDSITIDDV